MVNPYRRDIIVYIISIVLGMAIIVNVIHIQHLHLQVDGLTQMNKLLLNAEYNSVNRDNDVITKLIKENESLVHRVSELENRL